MKKAFFCLFLFFLAGCEWEEPYLKPLMNYVKGGTFQMGRRANDTTRDTQKPTDDEVPHPVTVDDFSICKYEVTVEQFRNFCEDTGRAMPAGQVQDDHPVTNVTWDEAVAYCSWLSEKTGEHFRLPTEAEWEYAARGGIKSTGTIYSGSNTLSDVGWYNSRSIMPVGQKKPNELELYDMSGNAWEWCSDWYGPYTVTKEPVLNPTGPAQQTGTNTVRVHRGGSYAYGALYCRVAFRGGTLFALAVADPTTFRDPTIGFRVVSQ
ncbi:MAG: SUMF1/EgtB/PvdO family nonheme iron enzyme [Spirosomataceae bacterium]